MAETVINTHDGTFKTEGSISLEEARLFMNNRTGVDIAKEDNSLENLFTVAAANGITLPNSNSAKPYSISELYGMSYQNNTPPVISLLGPSSMFADNTKFVSWNPEAVSKTTWIRGQLGDHSGYDSDTTWTFGTDGVCKFRVYGGAPKAHIHWYDFGTYTVGTDGVAIGTMNFGGSDFYAAGDYTEGNRTWADSTHDFAVQIMDPSTGEPLDQITAPFYDLSGWPTASVKYIDDRIYY